jgi:hypothetical protein
VLEVLHRERDAGERSGALTTCDPVVDVASSGERAVSVVVGDDVFFGRQVPARERGRERGVARQRVTAEAFQREVGKIAIEVRVDGAGDVGGFVIARGLGRVGEIEARVDDEEVRLAEAGSERFGRDQKTRFAIRHFGILGNGCAHAGDSRPVARVRCAQLASVCVREDACMCVRVHASADRTAPSPAGESWGEGKLESACRRGALCSSRFTPISLTCPSGILSR